MKTGKWYNGAYLLNIPGWMPSYLVWPNSTKVGTTTLNSSASAVVGPVEYPVRSCPGSETSWWEKGPMMSLRSTWTGLTRYIFKQRIRCVLSTTVRLDTEYSELGAPHLFSPWTLPSKLLYPPPPQGPDICPDSYLFSLYRGVLTKQSTCCGEDVRSGVKKLDEKKEYSCQFTKNLSTS